MGLHSGIGWCDCTSGLTAGCGGCELGVHCYARTLCNRFRGKEGWPDDFSKPELYLDRLLEALRWKDLTGTKRPEKPWLDDMPRIIFCCELGEPFDEALPEPYGRHWLKFCHNSECRRSILWRMEHSPHQWLFLTKQPQAMAEVFAIRPCPPNVWLGVSVTSQETAWRIDVLRQIDCQVRFVSFEPLLGPVKVDLAGIQWVIIGGETGKEARGCGRRWIRDLRDMARDFRCRIFVKQLGAQESPGISADLNAWPEDLRVREMPIGGAT